VEVRRRGRDEGDGAGVLDRPEGTLTPSSIDDAVRALGAGELVVLPTETVYGLAADASDPIAVAKIFEAKGRPRFNPLIAHVHDLDAAREIAVVSDHVRDLAWAFWPGPLTLVLPVRDRGKVCDLARAGLDTVAVRIPGHAKAREVIARFGGPVVAPSANRSGRPSPTTFHDAVEETGFAAGAVLDGGHCAVGVESTVVAVLNGDVRLLRPGAVTREDLKRVVGEVYESNGHAQRSPGRLATHYAPDAPVRVEADRPEAGEAYLAFGPDAPSGPGVWNLSPTGDLREAAANLFRMLREADRTKPVGIAVAPVPHAGLGEALNDRLKRAAGYVG
jgi:L-threonylcarbamoyladenylate synthase